MPLAISKGQMNGENYSCKILTQTLMVADQARYLMAITGYFRTPAVHCGAMRGLLKSSDRAQWCTTY
jgi:hypothetical protein